MNKFTITLPPEIRKALDAIAAEEDRSTAAVVRRLIVDHIKRNRQHLAYVRRKAEAGADAVEQAD